MRCVFAFALLLLAPALFAADPVPLPGTKPLTMEGDIAAQLVEGVDRFLLKKIEDSAKARDATWPQKAVRLVEEATLKLLEGKRQRLAQMLGVRDKRVPFDAPELLETVTASARIAAGPDYVVYAVRWPTIGDMYAEGLLIQPQGDAPVAANVVAIPDADQTPEQIVGVVEGAAVEMQFGLALAERRCRILIPTLISRKYEARNGRAKMTNREFIYRSAFEMGRHVIGYEIQQVLAAVDYFAKDDKTPIAVVGYGEGGMLALYSGAIDPRIKRVGVAGYFGRKERVWQQPIDRNVFGILNEFGDGDVAAMITGELGLESSVYPTISLPSEGGAPGELKKLPFMERDKELNAESARIGRIIADGRGLTEHRGATPDLQSLAAFAAQPRKASVEIPYRPKGELAIVKKTHDSDARQARLMHAMDRHNQWLLTESPYVRAEYMKGLDTSSPEKYAKTVEVYREKFKREVIGWFDDERLPFNPRTRKIDKLDTEKFTGYEVVLDVWPDVIAYGILLLPKDMKADEKRPVVVCQHGLEGRPQDIVQDDHPAYHDFAAKLAERGFITFSPQNLYIGKDKFRTLQRKANPLGRTLFSIIIPQHQQIVDWLKTQPNVDPKRIGFYGLSYGGKSAMRIPPLVPDYCLSICSADFNDWVWKNASTRSPYSYVWTNEYEIFEWDLGSTFNYAEMAALIAPRPFMVERGHFDGVAPDETVGYEFAKVRNLYEARLKLEDKCEIEWFVGPHTINGKGTYKFLHKHLNWPEPK
jgi:cephalosporin-C deacetylase-like acetyl esterase